MWFTGVVGKSKSFEGSIRVCNEDALWAAIHPHGGRIPHGISYPGGIKED